MQQNPFHYRLIKARVAETIVKELFQVCGYNVFEYGMERTMPEILGRLNQDNSETALQIRAMPDFVVQSPPPGNELFYVEVKYRKNSNFPDRSEDLANYPFKNAWFIIVSQKDIRCISYTDIALGKKPETNDEYLLVNSVVFNLDKATVQQFQEYSNSFFKGVK